MLISQKLKKMMVEPKLAGSTTMCCLQVLKKYRATVQQLSMEQMSLQEQAGRVAELEAERASLREQLAELSTRVESMETMNDPNASLALKRIQLKAKELESKLELEQTTRARLEVSSFNIVQHSVVHKFNFNFVNNIISS